MEGTYGVYFANQLVGKVQVQKQGLYYRFQCRCRLTGDVVCRLGVCCGGRHENLGVVIPMDGGFGLDTKLPMKRFCGEQMEFYLLAKHETDSGNFAAVYPEEPFAYIDRLKNAYLMKKDGKIGVMLK